MSVSDERLAYLIRFNQSYETWDLKTYADTAAALLELQRLRRELGQMTSLAGSALTQLASAYPIESTQPTAADP